MDATMSSFTKYNILPNILRHHVLSYSSHSTLSDYAPCSKLCNMEVKPFHIHVPDTIEIRDWQVKVRARPLEYLTGVRVILVYKQPTKMTYDIIFLTFNTNKHVIVLGSSIDGDLFAGNGHDAAIEYVKSRLKYARIGKCATVEINLTTWPSELMQIPAIKNSHLTVNIKKSMYQGFYSDMKSRTDVKYLKVPKSYDDTSFTIPVQFFQSYFFQNLSSFRCERPIPEIPADCFLSMKATTIRLEKSILTDTVFNQKIMQWFDNPPTTPLFCKLLNGKGPVYRKEEILRNLPVESINDNLFDSIIDTAIYLKHETGVRAELLIIDQSLLFDVHLESWAQWKRRNSDDPVPDNIQDLASAWDI